MDKRITINEYQRIAFIGKPPAKNTVRLWCKNGALPAKKIGGMWLINACVLYSSSGSDLADRVLNNGA